MDAATALKDENVARFHGHNGELVYPAPENIQVLPGFNPRTYFDPTSLAELAESVRKDGVVQPIVIFRHPDNPDQLCLIAGERRLRASLAVELPQIPALLLDVDMRTARRIALIENSQRENMSETEEAEAARDILSDCNGDREAAARELGWSRKMLDARLLLLHASEAVRKALNERQIKTGHAELLATLTEDEQNEILPKVIEKQTPVARLREVIDGMARTLSVATFDTSECATCTHNSDKQQGLFDATVSAGKCTNRTCWDSKVAERLEHIRNERAEDFAVIKFQTEADPSTYKSILTTGAQGVGKDQMAQCKACKNFGVVLDDAPGREGKTLSEDACFDLSCLSKKQAAYQKSVSTPAPEKAAPEKATTASTNKGATTTAKAKNAGAKQNAGQPRAVVEAVNHSYREAARSVVSQSHKMGLVYAVLAMLREAHGISSAPLGERFSGLQHDRVKDMKALFEKSEDELVGYIQKLAGYIAYANANDTDTDDYLKGAKCSFALLEGDIADHFVLTRELLEKMTKGGIAATLSDPGVEFDKAYNEAEADEKAISRLMAGKKGDILDAVDKVQFDWKGKVPAFVREQGKVK